MIDFKRILFAALACPLSSQQLAHIQVPYWGFDHKAHTGILVVNKNIQLQVEQIFHEIYKAKFPIKKITPLENYGNNEEKAMEDNDTYAYHCKTMTSNPHKFSWHAYGMAIDVNPLLNPYVDHTQVLPKNSQRYVKRKPLHPGMISQEGSITKIFLAHGWKWGGNWKSPIDYQHFEIQKTQ